MNRPALFSFFSGLGFLDLGFEKAGFEIVLVNEKHPSFLVAYRFARGRLGIGQPICGYFEGDVKDFLEEPAKIRSLSAEMKSLRARGRLVGFVGGPPCPDFSVGGKNRGRAGDHGKLSGTFAELVCQQQPDFFLFENVKGLWHTKRHREFYEELKTHLHGAGYVTAERLINAIEYGVPQDRPRILLAGFKRAFLEDRGIAVGGAGNGASTIPQEAFPWTALAPYPGRAAFEYDWPERDPFEEESERPCPDGLPQELTVEYWFRENDVANHPNSVHCFKPRAGLARFRSVDEGDDSRKSFKRLHRWRYSPTVCYGNNEVHLHPYRPRRISAAEAMALQSLPNGFELPEDMSLSDMFKGIGNGVPYRASELIAKAILAFVGQ